MIELNDKYLSDDQEVNELLKKHVSESMKKIILLDKISMHVAGKEKECMNLADLGQKMISNDVVLDDTTKEYGIMCTLINRYIVRMLNLIFSKSIDSEIFTVMMKCPFKEQEKEHIKKYLSEEDVVKYESVFQIYNMLIDKEYPISK